MFLFSSCFFFASKSRIDLNRTMLTNDLNPSTRALRKFKLILIYVGIRGRKTFCQKEEEKNSHTQTSLYYNFC